MSSDSSEGLPLGLRAAARRAVAESSDSDDVLLPVAARHGVSPPDHHRVAGSWGGAARDGAARADGGARQVRERCTDARASPDADSDADSGAAGETGPSHSCRVTRAADGEDDDASLSALAQRSTTPQHRVILASNVHLDLVAVKVCT